VERQWRLLRPPGRGRRGNFKVRRRRVNSLAHWQ
jgi:hypothetical protein